jgi:D-proline reductase (dithiol) PrdB
VKPPRSVFLKWPYGHPLGEPGAVNQQTTVLLDALRLLATATQPGVIVDLPYRWKREKYD